ncbi:MAG: hypothetical protein R2845_05950 [Thermomicrobiales bacterium]
MNSGNSRIMSPEISTDGASHSTCRRDLLGCRIQIRHPNDATLSGSINSLMRAISWLIGSIIVVDSFI